MIGHTKQDLADAVRDYLKIHAFGRVNTIKKNNLAMAILGSSSDTDIRKVREVIPYLIINQGCPICSSSSGTRGGYWWFNPEDDPAHFNEAYNTDISYAREMESRARHLKDNVEYARIEHLRKKAEEEKPLDEPLQQEIPMVGKAC